MVELIAAQHFFSSVSASESPRGRRGYQTLFHTEGLAPDAVKVIEDYAQYNAQNGEAKFQYYPLPGHLFAIAKIVPLDERDEFGRKGRYLAHTLVLRAAVMAQVGFCPLDILEQFEFATRLDTVFAQCDRKTGRAPSVQLPVRQAWSQEATRALQGWQPGDIDALGAIVWAQGHPGSIHVLGATAERWRALSVAFLLAAERQRPSLSFDTLADGCRWAEDRGFRFLGYADEAEAGSACRIDSDHRRVAGLPATRSESPYARWMRVEGLRMLQDGHDISPCQSWALSLDALLAGEPPEHPIDQRFASSFARLNSDAVVRAWMRYLPEGLSAGLTALLAGAISRDVGTGLQILSEGLRPADLDVLLFDELIPLQRSPTDGDQRILRQWARDLELPRLATLVSLWAREMRTWTQQVRGLDATDYERLVTHLTHWPDVPLPLWTLLVEPHTKLWIELAAPVLPVKEWQKALPLLNAMEAGAIEWLAPVVPRLVPDAQQEIRSWLRKNRSVAPGLEASLGSNRPPKDEPRLRFWRR